MQKILYFVMGNPTKKQEKEAASMGAVIRNAEAWHNGDFIEQCDSVAGEVPAAYKHLPAATKKSEAQQGAELDKKDDNQAEAQQGAVINPEPFRLIDKK